MQRRTFLQSATATTAALLTQPRFVSALDVNNPFRKEIGIQLYTLRNQIDNDVSATIRKIADAGYKQVEPYGFPNCRPMIEAAAEFGLNLHSTHFDSNSLINNNDGDDDQFDRILEQANDVGLKHLVVPYLPDKFRTSLDDYKRLTDRLNKASTKAKAVGIQLAYHNHAFEFKPMEENRCGYDVMMDEFGEDMAFEVDVFWVAVAGKDPNELLRKLAGRVSQVHLKDLNSSVQTPTFDGVPKEAFEEIGDGTIDIESIMQVSAEIGVKHAHVEQDQSPHPIESVLQSLSVIQSM
ncbi:MAG: sugar phosphate isomerase/epimerase [Planctomycetota bacterium]